MPTSRGRSLYGDFGEPVSQSGLIAGGSLLVDYMLTVAVSVSSVQMPSRQRFPLFILIIFTFPFCLVLLLMLMNLRGLRESATSLMIPVYLFIVSTIALIGYGVIQILTGHLAYNATATCWPNHFRSQHHSLVAGLYEWIGFPNRGLKPSPIRFPSLRNQKQRMLPLL